MTDHHDTEPGKPIIVYDGICKMCNRSLQFVLSNDSSDQFVYIPFQTEQGQLICDHFDIEFTESTSLLLIEYNQILTRSLAWERILSRLSPGYKLLSLVIRIIPTALNDRLYDYIGRNRYRWFGKSMTCSLATPNPVPDLDQLGKRLNSNSGLQPAHNK